MTDQDNDQKPQQLPPRILRIFTAVGFGMLAGLIFRDTLARAWAHDDAGLTGSSVLFVIFLVAAVFMAIMANEG
jgi:hypothetical protein